MANNRQVIQDYTIFFEFTVVCNGYLFYLAGRKEKNPFIENSFLSPQGFQFHTERTRANH